jgi:G1/S-specific cyclin PLC1
MPCTRHRVFLATLIVAAKYLNDSSPKNKHWCHYAGMFSQGEINLMEKQVLFLFDYNLSITEEEVVAYAKPFTEEYSFNTPALSLAVVFPAISAQTIPVTPRLPPGAAVLPSSSYSSKVNHIPIPQARDRSVSISSLGSDGPFTPRSPSSSPSQDLDNGDEEILALEQALVHAHGTVFGGTQQVHIADSYLLPNKSSVPGKDSPTDARESLVRHLCGRHRHHLLHMYDPAAIGLPHRCAA